MPTKKIKECFYGFWILKPPMLWIFNGASWRWNCHKKAEWKISCKMGSNSIRVDYYYCSKHLGKSLAKIALEYKHEIIAIKRVD